MLTSLMCSSIRLIRCLEEMLDGCYIRHFGSSCSLALRTAFDQDGAHSRFPGHALTPTGVMAIRCKQFHLPDL